MKRNLMILLFVVLAVALVVAGMIVYGRLSSMNSMRLEKPDQIVGPIYMDNLTVIHITPDIPYRIDMGSSVNTINKEYLQKLKAMGCEVDSQHVLTLVDTALGKKRLSSKRYRVSLPIFLNTFTFDSAGVHGHVDTLNRINTIHGVDFVEVGHPSEMPRLGIPFFKKFYLECDYKIRALRFHDKMPANYEEVSGVMGLENSIFSEPKAFLNMNVNGESHNFYLNSSMPRAGILMPKQMAPAVDGKSVFNDTIHSVYGNFPVVINYDTWVDMGTRAGKNVSYYLEYGPSAYALNPFNFLTQNAVFDFKNGKFYLRPRAKRVMRVRDNDEFRR